MPKLYFKYGTTNSGKSIELLKVAHNYEEQGKKVILITSSLDDRYGKGKITSRVGIESEAFTISPDEDIVNLVAENNYKVYKENPEEYQDLSCVLIDEAQFLSKKNVLGLTHIVDKMGIPVIAYGLKVDFSNYLFEGAQELLIQADKIEEIKTICNKRDCERKAIMNIRIDSSGKALYEGEQVQIGGNESYVPVCRNHYYDYNKEESINE